MRINYRYMFGVVAAAMVSLVFLYISGRVGRLAHDVTYDDIGYFNDAVDRLACLHSQGLRSFVATFSQNPPHSPLSTMFALSAMALAGYHTFAVYATNALLLVLVATFILGAFKELDWRAATWILATALTTPMAFEAIQNFRPDYAVGFASTAMGWWFVTGVANGTKKHIIYAGLAFAAALLIKPSFFAHTIALAVALTGLFVLIRLVVRENATEVASRSWFTLCAFWGVALVISLPYYGVAWKDVFDYFWNNTRGADAHLWSFGHDLSLFKVIRAYLGSTYQHAIGFDAVLSGVVIVGSTIDLYNKRKFKDLFVLALLLGFALLSFSILVFGRHKNDFFFATFQSTLLLASFFGFARFYGGISDRRKRSVLVFLWLALAGTTYANVRHTYFNPQTEDLLDRSWNRRVLSEIIDAMGNSGKGTLSAPLTVLATVPGPVNAHTIKWLAAQQGVTVRQTDLDRSGRLSDYVDLARRVDFVVVPNEGHSEFYQQFPGTAVQSALLDILRHDSQFEELVPTGIEIQHYFVFKNLKLMSSVDSVGDVLPFYGLRVAAIGRKYDERK